MYSDNNRITMIERSVGSYSINEQKNRMSVVMIKNKKKNRKGIIKECSMGIIVKLGQCIKTKKKQRRNKVSLEVLTGLPLTVDFNVELKQGLKPALQKTNHMFYTDVDL